MAETYRRLADITRMDGRGELAGRELAQASHACGNRPNPAGQESTVAA